LSLHDLFYKIMILQESYYNSILMILFLLIYDIYKYD